MEFALIVPLLLLLLFGIIEFGVVLYSYTTIASAAREGARAGVVPSASVPRVMDAVMKLAPLNLKPSDVTISLSDDTVSVRIEYDVRLLTASLFFKYIGANPVIHLHTVATMQRE